MRWRILLSLTFRAFSLCGWGQGGITIIFWSTNRQCWFRPFSAHSYWASPNLPHHPYHYLLIVPVSSYWLGQWSTLINRPGVTRFRITLSLSTIVVSLIIDWPILITIGQLFIQLAGVTFSVFMSGSPLYTVYVPALSAPYQCPTTNLYLLSSWRTPLPLAKTYHHSPTLQFQTG